MNVKLIVKYKLFLTKYILHLQYLIYRLLLLKYFFITLVEQAHLMIFCIPSQEVEFLSTNNISRILYRSLFKL
jgi:hypothetical protein